MADERSLAVHRTARLAQSLCAASGLGEVAVIEPVALSSTNDNFVVTDRTGLRTILRRYQQRPEPHSAAIRLRREAWALETLAAAGAPVPRLLAVSEEAESEAVLMEFAEGELLGDVIGRLPPSDAGSVWRAAGRALAAVHAIDNAQAAAAGCEQVCIRAPEASRGLFHYEEARLHLERLAASRPDLPNLLALRSIVEEAVPLFERAPLVLCQYDVHLWQFMVAPRGAAWECTAVLDWEHIDLDDPDWDLAQLDVFRFVDLAETPRAFFEGYGRTPSSPLYTLYRCERAAWTLEAHRRGEDWLALSVPLAERFLRGVLSDSVRLRRNVQRATAGLG